MNDSGKERGTLRLVLLTLVCSLLASCGWARPATSTSRTPGTPALAGLAAAGTTVTPPTAVLALARDQQAAGEYGPMEVTLRAILAQHPAPPIQRETDFRLAEVACLRHDPSAVASLQAFVSSSPQHDEWYGEALFLLARAQEDGGDHAAAIASYARYRDLHTPLEPYALLRSAAQQGAAGDGTGQRASLEAAAAQAIAPPQRAAVLEQLIKLYQASNDTPHLLARYTDLVAVATKPDYRAKVLWRAAQVATGEQRQRWLLQLVHELPLEPEAADAATELAGRGLDVYQAARILHWHDRFAAAIPLFDQALTKQLAPADHFEALRLRALDLRGQKDFNGALQALGALAQTQPPSPASIQAELDYIQTAGQGGNRDWAIAAYRRFAATHAADALAAEALWRAVQLQQSGDVEGSTALAEQLGRAYPRSTQGMTALAQAGLYRYQHGASDTALADWQLLGSGEGPASAEGSFWAGATLLQRNRVTEGQQALVAADAAAPASYYGARARELLKRSAASAVPLGTVATGGERAAVEQWLQSWLGTAVPPVDGGWRPELVQAPAVQRALALAAVDLRDEADDEWTAAGDQWHNEPDKLWQLALLANREGFPYPALLFAERIVALSPAKHIAKTTPPGLLRLIYPTPYARVVRQYAVQGAIDPRLLYGLLRQESLFNPDATSWVGARGLAQVMPATAQGIAQSLGIADFNDDQLYHPAVAIRFGAHYLAAQLRAFDGHVQAAAAAYNGGPGNAQRWLEQTTDHDLFTELIDYRESRDYVKLVYGNWAMYRDLYQE